MPMLATATAGGVNLAAGMSKPFQSAALAHPSSPVPALAGSGRPLTGAERRVIAEPYRQAFGRNITEQLGRPAGWTLLMSAIEKVFFPTSLLMMLILGWWEELAVTAAAETAICVFALAMVMKGKRVQYGLKALAITPIRYALLAMDLVTMGRFAVDLWVTRDRRWRK
jgi:hypothetical protein